MTDTVTDRIERSIDIDAPAEVVYSLVSRPGWWINADEVDPEPDLRTDGQLSILRHPVWGEFEIRTVDQRPPAYIAFRWSSEPLSAVGADAETTLVEFFIEPIGVGVQLRVVESGFSALTKPADRITSHVEENTSGWESELAAARRYVLAAR
ncbi:ATPase [Naumannella halotolerans]|uniref:ATPase n=1 Tax=Naumannella halotolerans TaxID=993414 RepID=UPI00370D5247